MLRDVVVGQVTILFSLILRPIQLLFFYSPKRGQWRVVRERGRKKERKKERKKKKGR
jgi:hypothetical protein